jgi:hypothetical protein
VQCAPKQDRQARADLRTNGSSVKKPARNGNKKFGKLTVLTYACNNLTNLEYEVHPFTGDGNVECGFKKQ